MSILLLRARLLGADDISFGRNSIVYVNYLGITHTIAQVNASHIPIAGQQYFLEDLFNGSFGPNIYPNILTSNGTITSGGNLISSGTLVVSGNTTLNGTVTIPSLNVAGYVKNTAAGLLTGGNGVTISINDIPQEVITGSAAYGESNTGTDAYEVTFSPALTSYEAGQLLAFMPDTTNVGACSLDANGIGAVAIKQIVGGAQENPFDSSILADEVAYVVYNGDSGTFVLINPAVLPSQANSSNTQTFTSSDTWTKPTGVTLVKVLLIAAGGGGGGASAGVGGGSGGGGGNVILATVDVSAVANVAVTIGAVGTGGAGGNPGSAGGNAADTTFGAFLTADGGLGGAAGAGTAGSGGVGTLYTEEIDAISFDGYGGTAGTAGAGPTDGGAGGDSGSHRGEGGAGGTSGNGGDGGNYGAGGGGGYTSGALHYAGGDGGPGLCIVWW